MGMGDCGGEGVGEKKFGSEDEAVGESRDGPEVVHGVERF
jgi:hypothetical protein